MAYVNTKHNFVTLSNNQKKIRFQAVAGEDESGNTVFKPYSKKKHGAFYEVHFHISTKSWDLSPLDGDMTPRSYKMFLKHLYCAQVDFAYNEQIQEQLYGGKYEILSDKKWREVNSAGIKRFKRHLSEQKNTEITTLCGKVDDLLGDKESLRLLFAHNVQRVLHESNYDPDTLRDFDNSLWNIKRSADPQRQKEYLLQSKNIGEFFARYIAGDTYHSTVDLKDMLSQKAVSFFDAAEHIIDDVHRFRAIKEMYQSYFSPTARLEQTITELLEGWIKLLAIKQHQEKWICEEFIKDAVRVEIWSYCNLLQSFQEWEDRLKGKVDLEQLVKDEEEKELAPGKYELVLVDQYDEQVDTQFGYQLLYAVEEGDSFDYVRFGSLKEGELKMQWYYATILRDGMNIQSHHGFIEVNYRGQNNPAMTMDQMLDWRQYEEVLQVQSKSELNSFRISSEGQIQSIGRYTMRVHRAGKLYGENYIEQIDGEIDYSHGKDGYIIFHDITLNNGYRTCAYLKVASDEWILEIPKDQFIITSNRAKNYEDVYEVRRSRSGLKGVACCLDGEWAYIFYGMLEIAQIILNKEKEAISIYFHKGNETKYLWCWIKGTKENPEKNRWIASPPIP